MNKHFRTGQIYEVDAVSYDQNVGFVGGTLVYRVQVFRNVTHRAEKQRTIDSNDLEMWILGLALYDPSEPRPIGFGSEVDNLWMRSPAEVKG